MNWRDPYELTESQARVLSFIKSHGEEKQMPPTRTEISIHMGWKSPNAAQEVLEALARKGRVKLMPGIARGILLARD